MAQVGSQDDATRRKPDQTSPEPEIKSEVQGEGVSGQDCLPRLYLFEAGWHVALKLDSQREYCYAMLPGQEAYHRLRAGELYLKRGDEKLCLPCASRRGIITTKYQKLADPFTVIDPMAQPHRGYEVGPTPS